MKENEFVNPLDLINEISNFVFTSKYARYNSKKKRRETWEEAVDRVEAMHLKKYHWLSEDDKKEIKWAFDLVRQKLVAPSMRSMQFGGKAIEAHEARIYNCATRHIDSPRAFSEVFYLLLCGCGVGYGLTKHFINRLPPLVNENDKTGTIVTYVVEDNIEGWADTIEALLSCYFKNTAYSGRKITFDFSKIRKRGTPIKTGGGKAPGHEGLKQSLSKIKKHLDYIIEQKHQSRLNPIDAYDILMHISDAVLSGGIRRSASIAVFELDDNDMLNAKTNLSVEHIFSFHKNEKTNKYEGKIKYKGEKIELELDEWSYKNLKETNKISWFLLEPQRARSNNSVLILRDQITFKEFENIIKNTKQYGEPGFIFSDHSYQIFNPCVEVAMIPVTDDGIAGVQYCVTGDTKILTPDGYKTILECGNNTQIISQYSNDIQGYTDSSYLYTENAKIHSIGKKNVYKIEMVSAGSLKITEDHPVLTQYGYIPVQDLIIGDHKLVFTHVTPDQIDKISINYANRMGVNVYDLLGWQLGDGWNYQKNNHTQVGWVFGCEEDLYAENVLISVLEDETEQIISENVYQLMYPDKPAKDSISYQETETGVKQYSITSTKAKAFAKKYNLPFVTAKDKNLNKNYWGWTKENKARYLSALFCTDGSVLCTPHRKMIQLSLSNPEMAVNIQIALSEFGITSRFTVGERLHSTRCKTEIVFYIGSKLNIELFKKHIGFNLHPIKQAKLEKLVLSYNQADIDKKYSSKHKGNNSLFDIKSIVKYGNENVYDVSTENTKNFIANGFVIHNCNLTTQNGTKINSLDLFKQTTKAATIIGTLQAGYTTFPYLSQASKQITEHEALLGVSITGMMDNPDILLNPEYQKVCATLAKKINKEWAKKLNINPAARITCIKPEGTSSLVLGSGSGIHPQHAHEFFRRVQCNKEDNVYKHFAKFNSHAIEPSVWSATKTDDVISFPITILKDAFVKKDLTAIKHLEYVKSTQQNWVETGTTEYNKKPIHHSVSCTIQVKPDEWEKVVKYLYDNRKYFSAVSLLAASGDKDYQQAPMEAITTSNDKLKFEEYLSKWKKVDYTTLKEEEDETEVQQTLSCSGGVCELV